MTQWRNGEMNWSEFFKGRSPNNQKTHEEMLNIPGHKGNANQNSLLLEWLPSRTQTTNVGEDAGESEPSYTVGVNES
jgi:hypothetical protein